MKISFILEDHYGPSFIKDFILKKQQTGLFFNTKVMDAKRVPISPKLDRVISAALLECDRVIIMADADGNSVHEKENIVKKFIDSNNLNNTKIVIFNNEIEDWICYSLDITIKNEKPSSVLKHNKKYRLKDFASKIDCSKLSTCQSFKKLESALA